MYYGLEKRKYSILHTQVRVNTYEFFPLVLSSYNKAVVCIQTQTSPNLLRGGLIELRKIKELPHSKLYFQIVFEGRII